jgi:hypothetical protein
VNLANGVAGFINYFRVFGDARIARMPRARRLTGVLTAQRLQDCTN